MTAIVYIHLSQLEYTGCHIQRWKDWAQKMRVPWDNLLYEQDHFWDILAQDMFDPLPL